MMMIMLAAAGALGGLLFWLIRRPDKDAKTGLDVSAEHTDLTAHDRHN